jgi:hypothetical protein
MTLQMWMYVTYLGISLTVAAWVGRALYRNGAVFLGEVLGDYRLAQSMNRLLSVSFYLINAGVIAVTLRIGSDVHSGQQLIERLSLKLGTMALLLGLAHLVNLSVLSGFSRGRYLAAHE